MRAILLFITLIACFGGISQAQSVFSPQNVATGGSVANASGIYTSYQNPANLMLRPHTRRFSLSAMQAGFQLTEGIKSSDIYDDYELFKDYFLPSEQTRAFQNIAAEDFNRNRFADHKNLYTHTSRYDVLIGGVSFQFNSSAFSVALRTRAINSFEQSSNWSQPQWESIDGTPTMLRILNQRFISFHELSLGYARDIHLLSGWSKGISKFYAGVNPKLIFGGMYFDGSFDSGYRDNGMNIQNTKSYRVRSVGDYSNVHQMAGTAMDVNSVIMSQMNDMSFLEQNGMGAGFDFGITYITNIGDDVSLRDGSREQTRKTFTISASVTDIGIIYYDKMAYSVNANTNSTADGLPEANTAIFTGRLGEFTSYLANDEYEQSFYDVKTMAEEDGHLIQLPTTLHIGTALQYLPLTLMANVQYIFSNPEFISNTFQTSLGTEVRLLRIIPVRGSVIFTSGFDTEYGFGTGLDLGFLEISAAIRIKTNTTSDNFATAAGIAGLTIRL